MKLFYWSSKFCLGILILLFFWATKCNQAQAVTFKFNNDFDYLENNYLDFSAFELALSPSLYLLTNQPKEEFFDLLDQPFTINFTALETTKPKLINNLISSIKELRFQKIKTNNSSQANIPILPQSKFNNIYKDVYDFDIDLVEHNQNTGVRKNSISLVIKEKIPNYVANWSNHQPSLNTIVPADRSWTRISSELPKLVAVNPNNNYNKLEFNHKPSSSYSGAIVDSGANRYNQNFSVNQSNIVTTSQPAVFSQQYQSAYSINLQNSYHKSESLQELERLLEQQKKDNQKQQDIILKKIEQERKNRIKETQKKQEHLRKKRAIELKRAKQAQQKIQRNLQREIINQQKT
jgi:hypothetical protein